MDSQPGISSHFSFLPSHFASFLLLPFFKIIFCFPFLLPYFVPFTLLSFFAPLLKLPLFLLCFICFPCVVSCFLIPFLHCPFFAVFSCFPFLLLFLLPFSQFPFLWSFLTPKASLFFPPFSHFPFLASLLLTPFSRFPLSPFPFIFFLAPLSYFPILCPYPCSICMLPIFNSQIFIPLLAQDFLTLLLFSHSVVSDSLRPHGLQHARLLCPSPSPGACSNSCPLSQ